MINQVYEDIDTKEEKEAFTYNGKYDDQKRVKIMK